MMKKAYSAPTAEMIVFDYREQVTASGGASGSWDDGDMAREKGRDAWDYSDRAADAGWDAGSKGGASGGW